MYMYVAGCEKKKGTCEKKIHSKIKYLKVVNHFLPIFIWNVIWQIIATLSSDWLLIEVIWSSKTKKTGLSF